MRYWTDAWLDLWDWSITEVCSACVFMILLKGIPCNIQTNKVLLLSFGEEVIPQMPSHNSNTYKCQYNGTFVKKRLPTKMSLNKRWSLTMRMLIYSDSRVHGANMGSIWGRKNPGVPHVGPMNFVIWVITIGKNRVHKNRWFPGLGETFLLSINRFPAISVDKAEFWLRL